MKTMKRWQGWRNLVASCMLGGVCAAGGCDLGTFTGTVSLSGREVIQYLVSSWVLTPIQNAINTGIDNIFDQIEGDEND